MPASILTLTRKDLLRRLAEPAGVLVSLAIPLAIAGAMVLTFGRSGGGERETPKLRLIVVNLDKGPISEILSGATQNAESARHMEVRQADSREEGLRLLRDEEYAAMVVIPGQFGETLLDGGKTRLEVVKNPAQTVMPIAAQQVVEVAALYVSGAARLLGDDGPRLRRLFEEDGWMDTAELTAMVTTLRDRLKSVDDLLLPPIIEVAEPEKETTTSGGGFDFITWMFPGMVVMALLFTALTQMRDLLRERDAGTLRRLLAAPLGAGRVLVSKVLAVGIIVVFAEALLMAIGSLGLGVRWGAALPLAAACLCLALAATGFSALVFSVVRTERQGDAFGGILTMVMSLLGGAFVPIEIMPAWMAGAARGTVNFWGNETLRVLAAGGGWSGAAPYMQVLAALGLTMTLIGALLLRRRHVTGAL